VIIADCGLRIADCGLGDFELRIELPAYLAAFQNGLRTAAFERKSLNRLYKSAIRNPQLI
jgi:hypothetical protein